MVVIHQNIVHPGTSGSDIESTADIPAYVAKHKPSVEPMLDLLRRSAEFQRFTDEALATITTAAKSNSTARFAHCISCCQEQCFTPGPSLDSMPLRSRNSSSLPRKGSFPDRRLMPLPAHSTSADHPVVPCNAQFRSPRSPLDSAMGTGVGSACPW